MYVLVFSFSEWATCVCHFGLFFSTLHHRTNVKGFPFYFSKHCCASSISWSSEYPLLFILDIVVQKPSNSFIVLLRRNQCIINWLVSLVRSGRQFLLNSCVTWPQNEWRSACKIIWKSWQLCTYQSHFLVKCPISSLDWPTCCNTIIVINFC